MTRTEYCNRLRRAGFGVTPMLQASAAGAAARDVTFYTVQDDEGRHVTSLVLWERGGEIVDFVSTGHPSVEGLIAALEAGRPLAAAARAAR